MGHRPGATTAFQSSLPLGHILLRAALLFAAILTARTVSAEPRIRAPNVRVFGDFGILDDAVEGYAHQRCTELWCSKTLPAARFTARVRGLGGLRLTVDEVRIRRPDTDDPDFSARRAVYVRGTARLMSSTEGSRDVGFSGVVIRRSGERQLRVWIPRFARRGFRVPSFIRIPLSERMQPHPGRVTRIPDQRALQRCAHASTSPAAPRFRQLRAADSGTVRRYTVDTEFATTYQDENRCSTPVCNELLVSIIDATSVIFESDIGIAFTVSAQRGPTFYEGITDISRVREASLLDRFSDSNARLFGEGGIYAQGEGPNIFVLFTGTEDENLFPLGKAYLGTVCKGARSSAVIRQTDSLELVVAHEFGHLFDANHTDEGIDVIEGTYFGIMGSSQDPAVRSFSPESVASIRSHSESIAPECGEVVTSPPIRTPAVFTTPTPAPPPPLRVKASAKASKSGSVTVSIQLSEGREACTVVVSAKPSSGRQRFIQLTEFTPRAPRTDFSATVPFRLKSRGLAFRVDTLCPFTVEVKNQFVSFDLSLKRLSRSLPELRPKQWIAELAARLQRKD